MKLSVLDHTVHARLIADIDDVCRTASVPRTYIESSMAEFCGADEIDWVRRYPEHRRAGNPGLLLHGGSKSQARCFAIAAALIRNFVDARVVSLNTLLIEQPDPTVLVCPNLYHRQHDGKPLAAHEIRTLYDLLLSRMAAGRQTVVFVESMGELVEKYGVLVGDLLSGYLEVKNKG